MKKETKRNKKANVNTATSAETSAAVVETSDSAVVANATTNTATSANNNVDNTKGEIEMTNETINNTNNNAETSDSAVVANATTNTATSAADVDILVANYQAAVAALAAAGITIPNAKIKTPANDAELIGKIEQYASEWTPTEFGKQIKLLSNQGVEELASRAGVKNLWESQANESIRRMRLIMELKATYYPTECGHLSASMKSKKDASGFKALSTDALLAACTVRGLNVTTCDNDAINRMRATMLLKAVGVTAEALTA